jgi:hypothetical protein
MLSFLILGIYFLLLLFGDGVRARWNCFLHDGSVEDAGNNYGVSILTGLMVRRLLFPNGDIKVKMVSLP